MQMYHMCSWCLRRTEEHLKLQVAVNQHVGPENWTQVPCKGNKFSKLQPHWLSFESSQGLWKGTNINRLHMSIKLQYCLLPCTEYHPSQRCHLRAIMTVKLWCRDGVSQWSACLPCMSLRSSPALLTQQQKLWAERYFQRKTIGNNVSTSCLQDKKSYAAV